MSPLFVSLLLVALLIGAMVPVQSGSNAMLARYLGHPLYAAATNTGVATLVLLAVMLVVRMPPLRTAGGAPWWCWLGGLYGATLVASAIMLAPRLGATAYVAATIAGTMTMSLAVDHYGLMAFPQQPVTASRLVGVALVVAGMLLVARR